MRGCCHRLLCPVIDQFMKIIGERASLVVAVVGLDLSEPSDWLRRRQGCGRGVGRLGWLGLAGGCPRHSGVER